jgi:hypothetical protein
MTPVTCIQCIKCKVVRPVRAFRRPEQNPTCKTCTFGPAPKETDSEGRNCVLCHIWQTWDEFSPTGAPIAKKWSRCKRCASLLTRYAYWKKNADRPPPPPASRIDDDGRECTKCRVYQPWGSYTYDAKGPYKKASRCRDCQQKYAAAYYTPHPYEPAGLDDNGRQCTMCNVYKTWDQFHRSKAGINGRRAACKPCINSWCADRQKKKKGKG